MGRFNSILEVLSAWGYAGDSTSILILAGTFMDILPRVAATFAIIYWGLRIYKFIKDEWFK